MERVMLDSIIYSGLYAVKRKDLLFGNQGIIFVK